MEIKEIQKYKLFKNKKIQKIKKLKNQGVCNTTYKIKTPKKDYLLRVFTFTHKSKSSRKNEIKIQKSAYKKNIAAKVYILDEEKYLMICDFLKGKHKKKLKKEDIKTLVKNLKILHNIKTKNKPYKIKDDFKKYRRILKDTKSKQLIKSSLDELKKIKKYKFEKVLCHQDLNKNNVLFYKKEVKFIDWEFSQVNDRFFDLANISIEFDLNKVQEKKLLKQYLEKVRKADIRKLASYKRIYINFWNLWFKTLEKR